MKSWQEEPPALPFPALHWGEPRITRFIFELGFLGKEAKENKLMSGVYVIKQFPRSALGPLRFSPTPSDDPRRGRGGPRGRRASTPGQGGGAEDPDPPDGRHRLPCEATKDARGPAYPQHFLGGAWPSPASVTGVSDPQPPRPLPASGRSAASTSRGLPLGTDSSKDAYLCCSPCGWGDGLSLACDQ